MEIDEYVVKNVDEAHFVINFNNGKTLEFVSNEVVKYADAVSDWRRMKNVVSITGVRESSIQPSFIKFQIEDRNYPIFSNMICS